MCRKGKVYAKQIFKSSVSEPHHFYVAPVKNFDTALAPTLLYTSQLFLKELFFKVTL
jgi:hypothetical protein